MLLKFFVVLVAFLYILDGQILVGLLLVGFSGLLYALADISERLCELVEVTRESQLIDVTPTRIDVDA